MLTGDVHHEEWQTIGAVGQWGWRGPNVEGRRTAPRELDPRYRQRLKTILAGPRLPAPVLGEEEKPRVKGRLWSQPTSEATIRASIRFQPSR
jgi:hypothetical protein